MKYKVALDNKNNTIYIALMDLLASPNNQKIETLKAAVRD
jgi:hypothetical protein